MLDVSAVSWSTRREVTPIVRLRVGNLGVRSELAGVHRYGKALPGAEQIVVDEVAMNARAERARIPAADTVAPRWLFRNRHDDVDDVLRVGNRRDRDCRSLDGRQALEVKA